MQSPENTGRGLGIGLALARLIIELHAGEIEAFSEGTGQGSEFVVTLPLIQEMTESRLGPDAGDVINGNLQKARPQAILVVDEEVQAAQMLAALLEQFGHHVTVAYDGEEADRMACSKQFDEILSDIGLPGMDGYALARNIRSGDANSESLLIAMSGYAHDPQKRHAEDAGYNAYLVEPVNLRELQKRIAGVRW